MYSVMKFKRDNGLSKTKDVTSTPELIFLKLIPSPSAKLNCRLACSLCLEGQLGAQHEAPASFLDG